MFAHAHSSIYLKVTYFRVYLFLRMRVKSQKLVLANNWPPSCLMYPDRVDISLYQQNCKIANKSTCENSHLKVNEGDRHWIVLTSCPSIIHFVLPSGNIGRTLKITPLVTA